MYASRQYCCYSTNKRNGLRDKKETHINPSRITKPCIFQNRIRAQSENFMRFFGCSTWFILGTFELWTPTKYSQTHTNYIGRMQCFHSPFNVFKLVLKNQVSEINFSYRFVLVLIYVCIRLPSLYFIVFLLCLLIVSNQFPQDSNPKASVKCSLACSCLRFLVLFIYFV